MPSTPAIATDLPIVEESALRALRTRLEQTRLPRLVPSSDAAPGPTQARAAELLERWRDGFDWRALEARLQQLGHITATTADGRRLAAIHATATATAEPRIPILLVHGWPDSPLRFVELIPLLTAAGHDVVAPAIPGFGWSDQVEGEMSREIAASDFHALMTDLGYDRYAVHGGDWGSAVATTIAQQHPDAVAAAHLTDVPFDLAFTIDRATASAAEVAYLNHIEGPASAPLYLTANTLQPNMVAIALEDSPIGLAAWLASLFDAWVDEPIDADHVLAHAALLWFTRSVRSSMRLYSEPAQSWGEDEAWGDASDDAGGWDLATVAAPTAFALFPADLATAPRELADRHFAVERFTLMPRGGHFAALEVPQLLADDMVAFLADKA